MTDSSQNAARKYGVRSFSSDAALAVAVADDWLDLLATVHSRGQPPCVALSGGRIAEPFFRATVARANPRQVTFARVHFFWADERCVPPAAVESNFAVADKHLLRPLQVSPDQIHRIRGELEAEAAARWASDELRRLAPVNADGRPILDLIILGMGEDGHVASLFPGLSRPEEGGCYRAVWGPKPPHQRVTLTFESILNARHVWVLVSGSGKANVLRDSLAGTVETPFAQVVARRQHTRVYSSVPAGL